jgi:SAM-dependent methyltransferase
MRKTFRRLNNKDYWDKRWSDIPADKPMTNDQVYPLKYALKTVKDDNGRILEAGTGAGRVQRYYHDRGRDIVGFDFIEIAVSKLKEIDPTLKVDVGDITNLKYDDESFKYLLAFGLYHNLENGLDKAVDETYRVLEAGGSLCASHRADNIQTKITDWLTDRRASKISKNDNKEFHKMNLTHSEFKRAFEKAGFIIESIEPVENMPILYKFRFFRAVNHKVFNENIARSEGYRLSKLGQFCQDFLMYFFPHQFCNIYVLIAHKKSNQ